MREIVLDTETTGLNPNNGDRIVEIGCVELHRYMPTSKVFRRYINPERDMPDEAFRVHGLSTPFLADKPTFAEIAGDLAKAGRSGDDRRRGRRQLENGGVSCHLVHPHLLIDLHRSTRGRR